jgi:hypothetical protein
MGDHLIVLHSAVRACAGYSRHEAPSMLMDGSSVARDTEHGRAVTAQLTRRHGTLEDAIEAGVFALGAAGLSKGIRRQARAACEDYFYNRLSLTPSYKLDGREEIVEGLELMPDPMYRALEDIVELVVDGDYDELHDVSGHRLEVEDLRRRVEDDCPQSLVLPPREIYRSRRSPSPTNRTCRAGPTFSTCGRRPARRACTSRASSSNRASASRRRSTTSCP